MTAETVARYTRVGDVVAVVTVLPICADVIEFQWVLFGSLVYHDMWRKERVGRIKDNCVRLADIL